MIRRRSLLRPVATAAILALLPASFAKADEPLSVVATFSILGDMVSRIGGTHIELTTLVGPNGDAHVYQPTPADAKAVSRAELLFVNGLEFEGWLGRLAEASSFDGELVVATNGVDPIPFDDGQGGQAFEWAGVFDLSAGTYRWSFAKVDGGYADPAMKMVVLESDAIESSKEVAEELLESNDSEARRHDGVLVASDKAYVLSFDEARDMTVFTVEIKKEGKYAFFTEHMPFEFEADEHFLKDASGVDVEPIAQEPDTGHHGHHHGAFDPHAWQSIGNALLYVDNITAALSKAAPAHATSFNKNRAAYVAELKALEAEIVAMIATLPENQRSVVTAHDAFGYFEATYGLTFKAPQGVSTESEASAADVAKIIVQIRKDGIAAVFMESISDNRLLEQISRETGAAIGGTLYSDALSGSDGPASTYLDMMRYNTMTLTQALGS